MREVQTNPPAGKPRLAERLGNAIDRALYAVAPSVALTRMSARLKYQAVSEYVQRRGTLKLGHPAMRPTSSRDSRWFGSRQMPDEQLQLDRENIQRRAVEMVQSNPHAAGAIEGRVSHEVGVGLGCRPNVNADDGFDKETAAEINRRLKRVCKHWSRHGVDRRRRLSLSATQRLACRTFATYGEAFALLRDAPYTGPIGLTVEIINPMRVETPPEFRGDPSVSMGIRYHKTTNQIIGYFIRKTRVKGQLKPEYEFVRRYNAAGQVQIVHVFEEMFAGQSRGLPWLTASMAFLKDLDDFHESELISKQVESCFSIIMKGGKNSASPHDIAEANASQDATAANRIEDIYPGMIHYANEGEEPTILDPSRPGGTFAPFVEQTLRAAASGLNYPYELLAKNFFRTTYSSGRLAMLDGRLGFRMRSQVLIDQLLVPMWIRLVDDAFFYGHMDGVATRVEYLADRSRFEDHSWGGNSFGSVDPEKEAKANTEAVKEGQKTLSEVHAEKDQDWSDSMEQRDVELRKEIELRLRREAYERDLRAELGLADPNDVQADDQSDDDSQGDDANPSSNQQPANEQQMQVAT